jgi:hypothetical protein
MTVRRTLPTVTSCGVTGTLIQPVADLAAQLVTCWGHNLGTIGNAEHLWNGGTPRAVANRRHGDHTPWSADGSPGFIYAIDIGQVPGLAPYDLLTRFLVPTVRAHLYPEYKYGISGFELYDARPRFGMRKQAGGDGFDHCHLSFMPDAIRRRSTILTDAVLWHRVGRPNPVAFVQRLRDPVHKEDVMQFFSAALVKKIKAAVYLGQTERAWRKRQLQLEHEVAQLERRVAQLEAPHS